MLLGLSYQVLNVPVVEGVVNHLPLPAVLDQPVSLQKPKVMGYGRQAYPHDLGEVADAQFMVGQKVHDPSPRLVTENFEDLGQTSHLQQLFRQFGRPTRWLKTIAYVTSL